MRTIVWILAAAALVAGGCSKAKPSKRERCERVLGEMMGGMIAGLSAGLGDPDDPETRCMKANLRHPEKCMAPDEAADYKAKLAELVGQCEQWPDETLDCFRTFSDSPACERAFAALSGLQVSEVKAEGPPPAWEVTLAGVEDVTDLIAHGGAVYAQAEDRVIAIRDGAIAWQAEVPGLDAIVPGACVLVIGDEVDCLDARTGAVAWSLAGPVGRAPARDDLDEDGDGVADDADFEEPALDDDAPGDDAPAWRAAGWRGDQIVVLGDGGVVGVIDPGACAKGACVTTKGRLPGIDDDYPLTRSLVVRPDGGWAYVDDDHLILVGPDDAPTARLAVGGDDDGFVTALAVTPGGAIVVGFGRTIVRVDPGACKGGLDAALAAAAAPAGCVRELADRTDEPGDGYAPLPIGEDGVAFTVGTEVHVWRGGKKVWAADVRSAAGLLRAGDDLILAAMGDVEAPPEVRRVAAVDGATTWRTKLGTFPKLGFLTMPVAAADGKHVYVGYKDRVAAVPVAPAQGP